MSPNDSSSNLWVFGYGGLCWARGFEHRSLQLGFIRGYSRKFWQGNNYHRGTVEKPGRVVTVVEEDDAVTWGVAFELGGEEARAKLDVIERAQGDYESLETTFFPRDGVTPSFTVTVYQAKEDNPQWLGPAPLAEIAAQIAECQGNTGRNCEYLLRLAKFFHETLPEINDEHLFTLEKLVLERMKEINVEDKRDAQVQMRSIMVN